MDAYDIFENFNGNHPNKIELQNKFQDFKNVQIQFGDFYKMFEKYENNSIDILHIDIANNGDVYEYAIENYLRKVKSGGVILLEGGSESRDQVEWMSKYNKRPIRDYLKNLPEHSFRVVGKFPSITIINC